MSCAMLWGRAPDLVQAIHWLQHLPICGWSVMFNPSWI